MPIQQQQQTKEKPVYKDVAISPIASLRNIQSSSLLVNRRQRIQQNAQQQQQQQHSSSSSSSTLSATNVMSNTGWTILSMQHNPRENFLLRKLIPNQPYELEITAHSSAGSTQVIHQFITPNITANIGMCVMRVLNQNFFPLIIYIVCNDNRFVFYFDFLTLKQIHHHHESINCNVEW